MSHGIRETCTAFEGHQRIASGGRLEVALATKAVVDRGGAAPVLIFSDETGEPIEFDFRGSPGEVRERVSGSIGPRPAEVPDRVEPRGPGRPKLGVVAREVTLLPRHWEWLNDQPGGASVALRKLVEEARRANEGRDRARRSREAAYRFLSAMGGNLAGFEEAARALFAGDRGGFDERVDAWPADVRDHARTLAGVAFRGGLAAEAIGADRAKESRNSEPEAAREE